MKGDWTMKRRWFLLMGAGLALVFAGRMPGAFRTTSGGGVAADEAKSAPRVVPEDTYNAVTRIYFTNVAVHKGSPNPNPAKRRFRVDLKYWLMDAKYYDRGELSIGNPKLVDFVKKTGGKNLPASEPTTLSVMAYGIAQAVLDQYPIVQKVEVRLTHFSKGLEKEDESEDNHVVNIVLKR